MPASVAPMPESGGPKRFQSRNIENAESDTQHPAHLPALSNSLEEETEQDETVAPLPTAFKSHASGKKAGEINPSSVGLNRAVSEDGIRLRRDSTMSIASISGIASNPGSGGSSLVWSSPGAGDHAEADGSRQAATPLSRKEQRKKQKETEKQLRGIPLINIPRWYMDEAFFYLLNVSVTKFMLWQFAIFFITTALFGLLFVAIPGEFLVLNENGTNTANFQDRFRSAWELSYQTFSTIGYGSLSPSTTYGNFVAFFESFCGLMLSAMAAGIFFARMSKPESRLTISDVLCIEPASGSDGVPVLSIRMINERQTSAQVDVSAKVNVYVQEADLVVLRPLKLVRDKSSDLSKMWILRHLIDKDSPLHGIDAHSLADNCKGFVAYITGEDAATGSTMFTTKRYPLAAVLFGYKFVSLIEHDEKTDETVMNAHNLNLTYLAADAAEDAL